MDLNNNFKIESNDSFNFNVKVLDWNSYRFSEFHNLQKAELYTLFMLKTAFKCINSEYQINENIDFSIFINSTKSNIELEKIKITEGIIILISQNYIKDLKNFDMTIDFDSIINTSEIILLNNQNRGAFSFYYNELKYNINNNLCLFTNLASFLSKINQISQTKSFKNNGLNFTASTFLKYLEENLAKANCIREFEIEFNFSEVNLRRRIKALTGKTPLQHFHEKVHVESKKLLINSEKSIKEIAFELGFENESYFSKQFKKNEGITASRFRILSLSSNKFVQKFI